MFVLVIWLLRETGRRQRAVCTGCVSVLTLLRFLKLPHLFFQQTSNIFINVCMALIHFYALMCQNMILIQHWSTSVETATGWHEQWSSECRLTHAFSCLDFQFFMADVDKMMSSWFSHSAGLWVVSDISEEHAPIFRGHWFLPTNMQKER